jgi:hypothetical protein
MGAAHVRRFLSRCQREGGIGCGFCPPGTVAGAVPLPFCGADTFAVVGPAAGWLVLLASAASTRSGVSGSVRRRTPAASKIALPIAAGIT